MPERRFPPPWTVEDIGAAFVVKDSARLKIAVHLVQSPRLRDSAIGFGRGHEGSHLRGRECRSSERFMAFAKQCVRNLPET
jgi:hypothetical protein